MRILAVLVLLLGLAGCGSDRERESPPQPAPTPTTPAGWRAESWHGVELQVPATWVPGYSPMMRKDGSALSCGVGGHPFGGGSTSAPYVGRPGYGSDACQLAKPDRLAPPTNAVWFDSPLAVGDRDGARTVSHGGTTVTVAADDVTTRDLILRSLRAVTEDANGCAARKHLTGGWPTEGFQAVRRFAVCVYDGRDLVWSERRTTGDGEQFVDAFDHGHRLTRWPRVAPARSSVVLHLAADDPYGEGDVVVDFEVRFDPGRIGAPDGRTVELTPATVRPWSSEGLRLYCGPGPGAVARYFHPMLG